MKRSVRLALLLAALMTICAMANAQDYDDPPSRVARLQVAEGQISMQPGGVDEWIPAGFNRPLTTADRIWTDVGARAELTVGTADMMLGSETSMTFTNLHDNILQVELDQGNLVMFVRFLAPGENIEVDTPNFAFTINQPGEYRFGVDANSDHSFVSIAHGEGLASGQGDPVPVYSRQTLDFSQGQSLYYTERFYLDRDPLNNWSRGLEAQQRESISARYVPAGTVGYESLDGNGYWESSPVYGSVWYPNVAYGWAPYREGHWAWIQPWGWTWVDDAPWGFAPFHYGRWVNAGGRWGWIPGPREARPVYAPALVAWVGGVSIGVGGGGAVAWVPLGWHDPFIPSYHVSARYAQNVNISNSKVVNVTVINNYYNTTNVTVRNTTINNIKYENTTVNGAVTGASAQAMSSGRPMAKEAVTVSASQVSHANVMAVASVAPTHEAVLGGHAAAAAPTQIVTPKAVAARTAPPAPPVRFEAQKVELQKSGGMPLTPQAQAGIRATTPAAQPRTVVAPVKNSAPAAQPHPAPAATPAAQPRAVPAPAAQPREVPAPAAQPHPAPAATPAAQPHPVPAPAAQPREVPAPAAQPHPAPAATPAAQPRAVPAPSAQPREVPAPAAQPHPVPAPAARPAAPAPTPSYQAHPVPQPPSATHAPAAGTPPPAAAPAAHQQQQKPATPPPAKPKNEKEKEGEHEHEKER